MQLVTQIRTILLEQYIGAITIAFVFVNGISDVVNAVLKPVLWYVNTPAPYQSVLGGTSNQPNTFHWEWMLVPLLGAVLQFAAGYALLKWLYLQNHFTPDESAQLADGVLQDETSSDPSDVEQVTVLHEPE